jgi:hypothetical protein
LNQKCSSLTTSWESNSNSNTKLLNIIKVMQQEQKHIKL